jgi:hypothetical protein
MTRGPLKFKETDVKRVVKSTREAGLEVTRVEVTKTGSIVVHVCKADEQQPEIGNPFDKALS